VLHEATSSCFFSTKLPLKIQKASLEVKLLMFSKGNSSEKIYLHNHPKHQTGQWFFILKRVIFSH